MNVEHLDWNEILIISIHNGNGQAWRGWRKGTAVFNDPDTWKNPDGLSQYFKPYVLEEGWEREGAGMVVMNYDLKKSWCVNDWSSITTFSPWRFKATKEDEQNQLQKNSLRKLLASEEAKQDLLLTIAQKNKNKFVETQISLAELLKQKGLETAPLNQQMDVLSDKNMENIINFFSKPQIQSGVYSPKGWENKNNIGVDDSAIYLSILDNLPLSFSPKPNIQSFINEFETKLVDDWGFDGQILKELLHNPSEEMKEEYGDLLEDEENLESIKELYQQIEAFEALKTKWESIEQKPKSSFGLKMK